MQTHPFGRSSHKQVSKQWCVVVIPLTLAFSWLRLERSKASVGSIASSRSSQAR